MHCLAIGIELGRIEMAVGVDQHCRKGKSGSGRVPLIISASAAAEPQDMVQPSVPWPVFSHRLPKRVRPMSGTLDGVANVTPDPNGVCGLSTLAMRTAAPFLAAGWSLSTKSENRGESIWWILEGESYPRLSWEPRDQASSQNPPSEGERQGQDALAANRVAPATTAVANQRKASIARRQISRPQSVQMPAPQ